MRVLPARAAAAARRSAQCCSAALPVPWRTVPRLGSSGIVGAPQTGGAVLGIRCLPYTAPVFSRCCSGGAGGAAADEAARAAHADQPSLPRVLFKASPLTKQFATTETDLGWSALATGSGLGFALLGIAPFTPPNPYMVGLFLAVLQVRLAHVWMIRQLRAQTRRNVLEVKHLEGSLDDVTGTAVVQLTCDGSLTRTLRLGPPADNKPSIADVLKKGRTFVFLDEGSGTVVDADGLKALRQSGRVIVKEDFMVKPYADEHESEAEKTVQALGQLDAGHLKKLGSLDEVSPDTSLSNMQRSARLSGAVILSAGFVCFLGGRYAAEQSTAAATAPTSRSS